MSLFLFLLKKMRSERLSKFEEKVNFPQVVGAIDGTHVEIKALLVNPDYFNRKQKYSVVTQAVVDSRMMFMDIST